jgi:hypothetical protein
MKVAGPHRVSELAAVCLQSPHQLWQDSGEDRVQRWSQECDGSNPTARIQQSDSLDAWRRCWLPCTRYIVLSSRSDAGGMDVDQHAINMTVTSPRAGSRLPDRSAVCIRACTCECEHASSPGVGNVTDLFVKPCCRSSSLHARDLSSARDFFHLVCAIASEC